MSFPASQSFPERVEVVPETTIREYWLARAAQHTGDNYMGVPLSKFPEDLRVYEHLLRAALPRVVVEIGTQCGASALWFRDRLRTLAAYGLVEEPRVISVDLHVGLARESIERVDPAHGSSIVLLEGDVCDPTLREEVGRYIPHGAACMVVEDAAHVYDTTRAALELYADLVPRGGYFVVEDGCVDVDWMRLDGWPSGVLPAVREWLDSESGRAFRVCREAEAYGISCHPHGFLQRVA